MNKVNLGRLLFGVRKRTDRIVVGLLSKNKMRAVHKEINNNQSKN